MMKVQITIDVDTEYADPNHEMGVTNEAFERLLASLSWLGEDIDVERAGSQ